MRRGAQSPQVVLDAVARHLLDFNVQRGGRYPKSVEVDRVIAEARAKIAAWINAKDPNEVAFGMNATTFMRLVSLAIGQTLTPARNEIIVTDMDHHADISTWQELAKMGGAISWWRMREDHRLHVEDLVPLLSKRTRLVACTVVSHALGARVDVAAVARAAHGGRGGGVLGQRAFWPLMRPSTCRRGTAITSSAPAIRRSRRTWAFCGESMRRLIVSQPSERSSFRTRRRTKSRPARSSTRTSLEWLRRSTISRP